MTRSARLRAYAKLNLGLRVLYKRDDGYHEIRTVFQTVSLADTLDISFTSARKTTVTIDGTPEIADNLVEKASLEILEALSLHGDVRFNLRKRIPSGAGLGADLPTPPLFFSLYLSLPENKLPKKISCGSLLVLAATSRSFSTAAPRSVWGAVRSFTLCPMSPPATDSLWLLKCILPLPKPIAACLLH